MKEGWEVKKFENCIAKIPKPQQLKTSDYKSAGRYPIVSQEACAISGYTDLQDCLYHVDKPVVIFGDHTRVLKYIDFSFVVGADGVKILIPNNEFDSKFFYYYLVWCDIPSLGYSRHYKLLKGLDIPVPPLPTQEKIVSELDCINSIIEKKREQLKELDTLAQSIFYDMFGDPIQNEKGWEVRKLGEEFNISSGGTPNTKIVEYWENGTYSWIGSNMCHNEIIYQNDGKYITAAGLNNSSAKEYTKGYVLVALVGATIGKVALLKFDTTTNQNVAGIDVPSNQNYTSEFVYYLMQNLYDLFLQLGGDKFKMANLNFVRGLPLVSPPLPLQHQFASKIEAIEKQKELIKRSIAEVETLLASRMQYYFG